jgi:3-oxoacyl-[acyl-carrier protein] reductase
MVFRMVDLLKGKTVLITGSGRGIGRAIAEVCAKEGANVVISDIAESAKKTADEIAKKYNVKTSAVIGDVAEQEDAQKMAEAAVKLSDNGKIWGIVNNAGITRDATFKKMTEDQWNLVMHVNLKGVFWCTKAVLPHLEEGGAIVNISSIVGKGGNFGQTNYCTTKAGLVGFTKALAKEMARSNIRVNAIQPGFIKTPMTDKIPEKVVDKLLPMVPLGRWGQPEDVANAVLFLLSEMSSFMTGTVIEVAGGMFM